MEKTCSKPPTSHDFFGMIFTKKNDEIPSSPGSSTSPHLPDPVKQWLKPGDVARHEIQKQAPKSLLGILQ
jgi:hypothetical protein